MSEGWAPGERKRAATLAVVMLSAVLYPLRQHLVRHGKRKDGFPLSYYPMFSAKRKDTADVYYGVGRRADDSRLYLPHGTFGSGGLNQVRRQARRLARRDRAEELAQVVAGRVALRDDLTDVVRVEIVRGVFNIDDCFLNRRIEGEEEVLASAEVIRLPGTGGDAPRLEVAS